MILKANLFLLALAPFSAASHDDGDFHAMPRKKPVQASIKPNLRAGRLHDLNESIRRTRRMNACSDSPVGWYDADGPIYDCEWYAQENYYCEDYGSDYENFGLTANQVCCVCNGGVAGYGTRLDHIIPINDVIATPTAQTYEFPAPIDNIIKVSAQAEALTSASSNSYFYFKNSIGDTVGELNIVSGNYEIVSKTEVFGSPLYDVVKVQMYSWWNDAKLSDLLITSDWGLDMVFRGDVGYYVNDKNMPWYDHDAAAKEMGGNLVSVHDQEENDFLSGIIDSSQYYWIGGYKSGSSWKWSDGSIWYYENWFEGEPNNWNGIEDKLSFRPALNNQWNDLSQSTGLHGLYKFQIPPPDETCSLPRDHLLDVSSDYIAMGWSFGEKWSSCSQPASMTLGVCKEDYFCSYMDYFSCHATGGEFAPFGSCSEEGFTRSIEFYATAAQDVGSPTLKSCIRESVNPVSDAFCNEARVVSTGHHGTTCMATSTPHHIVNDGCPLHQGDQNTGYKCLSDLSTTHSDGIRNEIVVRCCAKDGSTCMTDDSCPMGMAYKEAHDFCQSQGHRLCTKDELDSDLCCNTGCNFDGYQTWTSDECVNAALTSAPSGHYGSCTELNLPNHVKLQNAVGIDADVCMKLAPASFSLSTVEGQAHPCTNKPPSYGGCDIYCQAANGFRQLGLKAIGVIADEIYPGSSGIISGIAGALWPKSEGESPSELLESIVEYVNDRIADAVSTTLLSEVKADWISMSEEADQLEQLIASGEDGPQAQIERTSRLNIILDKCSKLVTEMRNPSIHPIQLLPYVAPVGQACISFHFRQVYNYTAVTAAPLPAGFSSSFRANLNRTVQSFIDIAETSLSAAQEWRAAFKPEGPIYAHTWDGSWPCGWTCNHHHASLIDLRCPEVGGQSGLVGTSDICCHHVDGNNVKQWGSFYQALANRTFTDSYLGLWVGSSPPLWQYHFTSSVDAGLKPSREVQVAVSPLRRPFDTIRLGQADSGYGYDHRRWDHNQVEYEAMLQITDRSAHIDKIQFTKGDRIIGIRVHQTIDGNAVTNTVGRWRDVVKEERSFEPNEVISEVSVSCNGNCDFAFKTVFVDGSGAFAGNGTVWEPFGYQAKDWIKAPAVANFDEGYQPRLVGFAGWTDNYVVKNAIPMWLFEDYA